MKIPLDSYSLRARLLPVLLVLAPMIAGAAVWLPLESAAVKSLASVGALAALAVLLSHLARDMGKKKEPVLFARWGGPPTTRFLRHRDTTVAEATRERYRVRLASLIPEIDLPSSRSEGARPEHADDVYASCADWLREKTRDRDRFRLLFEENVSYGFRRNLWAMKPAGIALSAAGLLAGGIRVALDLVEGVGLTIEPAICLCASVPLLVWWIFRITPDWVAQMADSYARRLLAACEEL